MSELAQAAIIFGMFLLRLGVPLVITLAVAYGLRALDRRWQAEAQAQRKAEGNHEAAVEPQIRMLKTIGDPCWVRKGCPEQARIHCPAYRRSDLSCWVARSQAEGRLPAPCADCAVFVPPPMVPRVTA